MPYADPEVRRAFKREYARRRRIEDPAYRARQWAAAAAAGRARRQRLRRMEAAFKQTVGCAVCGYNEDPRALEVDHVVPKHLGGTGPRRHSIPSSWSARVAWLLHPNIQVLCATHHAIKTSDERRAAAGMGG